MKATSENNKFGVHYCEEDTCLGCSGIAIPKNVSLLELIASGEATWITGHDLALGESWCSYCGTNLAENL